MSTIDPRWDVRELARRIRTREISSQEVTDFYLQRLERWGESLGAVVTIVREHAMSRAAAADREIAQGRYRGPLHGVPYGVKDLLATRVAPTTWGAEPYRNQHFDFDAAVVERLDAAGAVLCAKLAMVELAGGFGYDEADASFTGPGRSPWNPEFWSGGSSSGPGAAVGAALVPFAIGSETSGSIITPAAFSGVSGFRPTYGVVSRRGAMALSWTLDKLGPMARSAADCRLVMQAIAGHDPADESTLETPPDFHLRAAASPLRIGVVRGTWEKAQPEVGRNFESTVSLLRSQGHHVEEIDFPDMPYGPVVSAIVDAEGASAFEEILRDGRAKTLRNRQDRIGGYEAASLLAIEYLRAMRVRRRIRASLLELFDRWDVVTAPARSTVAYPIGVPFREGWKGYSSGPPVIASMNLAGAPASVIPNGSGPEGLPTAVQFVTRPGHDPLALAVAESVQMLTAHHRRLPERFA